MTLSSDLAAIRARCEKATQGTSCGCRLYFTGKYAEEIPLPTDEGVVRGCGIERCGFHACDPQTILALLARLEEMQTVLVKAAIPLEALAWSVIDELSVQSKEEIAQAVAAIHAILRDNGT